MIQPQRSLGPSRIAGGPQPGLASALIGAGYDRKSRPAVVVDNAAALKVESKAGSFDGDIIDAVPSRFRGADLGIDRRYLFPHLLTRTVEADATSVASYRQKSRTLGDPANMIRDIDATSAKEETDTVAEAMAVELKMFATVQTGTPNILLQNDGFRSWVDGDLLAAYRNALDTHIVDEIAGAGIGEGGGGANEFEAVLYSLEVVRAAGYSPDLVVVSPADALGIQLLTLTGGDSYAFAQALPPMVVTTAVTDGEGFVADSSAIGTLHLGPLGFATFEENAGKTNTSTVRCESSGVFVVQRPDAAATLAAAS